MFVIIKKSITCIFYKLNTVADNVNDLFAFREGLQDVTKCSISAPTKYMQEKSSTNTEYPSHTKGKR